MAFQYDIVVLTDKRYLKDSKTIRYNHNVFYEDYLVQQALNRLGLKTHRLAWDDPKFNWQRIALCFGIQSGLSHGLLGGSTICFLMAYRVSRIAVALPGAECKKFSG